MNIVISVLRSRVAYGCTTQVLKLEQERRRDEGGRGGGGGYAKEIEELRKLVVDTARRKDMEISHLKTQIPYM
jgi:hypothetical protein